MSRSFGIFGLIFSALFAVGTLMPGPAHAVPHDGVTLSGTFGGVRFSSIHQSEGNSAASGSSLGNIATGTDIRYTWAVDGPVGPTSRQVFDRGPTLNIVAGTFGGVDFSIDLWTGTTVDGGLNTLSARNPSVAPDNPGPHTSQNFLLTQMVEGSFGFTIRSGSTEVFDVFVFDDAYDMGSVDAFGNSDNGTGDVVGTFLWGYTAGYDVADPLGVNSSTKCLAGTDQECLDLIGALYGISSNLNKHAGGLGIDIAYDGNFNSVTEPGALALLGLGLVGLGVARRRRAR